MVTCESKRAVHPARYETVHMMFLWRFHRLSYQTLSCLTYNNTILLSSGLKLGMQNETDLSLLARGKYRLNCL